MKKILVLFLTVVMLFTFGTIAVFATETEDNTTTVVATANDVGYATLADALEAGGEVVLLCDTTLTEKISVTKNVTLDLNGKTITCSGIVSSRVIVLDAGCTEFVLNGNGGSIVSTDSVSYGIIDVNTSANLTVNGGTYDFDTNNGGLFKFRAYASKITLNNVTVETNSQISAPNNDGNELVVNGGTFKAENSYNVRNVFAFYVESAKATFTDMTMENMYIGGVEAWDSTVTLENCNISIIGTNSAPYLSSALAVSGGGSLVINGGNYSTKPNAASDADGQGVTHGSWTVCLMSSGGTITVNGGTFTNDYYDDGTGTTPSNPRELFSIGADTKYGSEINSHLIINGGTFNSIGNFVHCETIWDQDQDGSDTATMAVTITGGDFTNCAKAIGGCDPVSTGNDVNVAISGGAYSASSAVDTSYLADGYALADNGDGTYTVAVAKNYAAQIGENKYETLAEAIVAAQDGDTVTLLSDVTLSEILVINKAITLDGNGYTLTSSAARAINVSGANGATIKNIEIVCSGERGINIIQGSTNVTIDNVTVTADNYAVNVASSAANAIVAISNSTLTGLNVVNVGAANAQITVNGGKLVCNDQNESESYGALVLNTDATNATITATNVTFEISGDSAEASNAAEGGEIIIDNEEQSKAVAFIQYGNNAYSFATLADAIAYAKAGDTIVLLDNITLDTGIVIGADKNITIDLNGYTISMEDSSSTTVAMIKNNGTLTIVDNSEAKTGKLTFKTTTPSASNSYASNTISNYGTLIVEGGTIENTSDGGACYAIDGYANSTTIINGGYISAKKTTVRVFDWTTGSNTTLKIAGGHIYSEARYAVNFNMGNTPTVSFEVTGGTIETNDSEYNLAVYVVSKGSAENVTINVTKGDFTGSFALNGKTAQTMSEGKVSITGGTFDGGVISYATPTYGFVSGGTFTEEFDKEVLVSGYVLEGTANGYTPAVATIEDIFTFKGYSAYEGGNGVTVGYTIDKSLFEAYCKQNGVEITLGAVYAATKIDANAIYKSFEGLELTTNYNISLKDMKAEHLDLAFAMALYIEVEGTKQYVTGDANKNTVIVDATSVEAITYNGVMTQSTKEDNE